MELSTEILTQNQPQIQNQKNYSAGDLISLKSDFGPGKSFSDILKAETTDRETNPVRTEQETKDFRRTSENEKTAENVKTVKSENENDREVEESEVKLPPELSLLNLEYNIVSVDDAAEKLEPESFSDNLSEISDLLLTKIENLDNQTGASVLTEGTSINFDPDSFDFEEVSAEEIALESAQGLSVTDPLSFLEKMETEPSVYENSEVPQEVKTEKSDMKVSKSNNSKITVTDLRTKTVESAENALEDKEPVMKVKTVFESSDSATITMDLRQAAENANQNILSENAQTASADGSNFQAMVNNEIFNNAEEFVRAGNIILKDNDKGTINLVLHPDDLGNVKIQLAMDGKSVTGHITVNTKEALEVFRNNAETLREAFIKNGFDSAGFDVALGGGNGSEFSGNRNDGAEQERRAFFGNRQYGALSTGAEDDTTDFSEDSNLNNFGINIVA